MQAYLAVQDASRNTIVVKKREINNWWGGSNGNNSGAMILVNQAGQWALPGGGRNTQLDGIDPVDSYIHAALREFREETGVDLNGFSLETINYVDPARRYMLVRAIVNQGDFRNILAEIQANIRSDSQNPGSPFGRYVVIDWEHQLAVSVEHYILGNYLGNRVQLGNQLVQTRVNRLVFQNDSHQAIDWYADMVPHL